MTGRPGLDDCVGQRSLDAVESEREVAVEAHEVVAAVAAHWEAAVSTNFARAIVSAVSTVVLGEVAFPRFAESVAEVCIQAREQLSDHLTQSGNGIALVEVCVALPDAPVLSWLRHRRKLTAE